MPETENNEREQRGRETERERERERQSERASEIGAHNEILESMSSHEASRKEPNNPSHTTHTGKAYCFSSGLFADLRQISITLNVCGGTRKRGC